MAATLISLILADEFHFGVSVTSGNRVSVSNSVVTTYGESATQFSESLGGLAFWGLLLPSAGTQGGCTIPIVDHPAIQTPGTLAVSGCPGFDRMTGRG